MCIVFTKKTIKVFIYRKNTCGHRVAGFKSSPGTMEDEILLFHNRKFPKGNDKLKEQASNSWGWQISCWIGDAFFSRFLAPKSPKKKALLFGPQRWTKGMLEESQCSTQRRKLPVEAESRQRRGKAEEQSRNSRGKVEEKPRKSRGKAEEKPTWMGS